MEVLKRLRKLESEIQGTPYVKDLSENTNENFQANKNTIIKAIRNREILGIYYEDTTNTGKVLAGFRLVEPYAYGRGYSGSERHKDDEYLRVFVIADTRYYKGGKKFSMRRRSVSKSDRRGGWRLMRVDRIRDVYSTKKKFSTKREEYNPADKLIVNIIVSAQPNAGRF
jgi:hypothetical protein|nr:MAG TPA: hypothetical protein [Caudoviricetes sp.]